MTRAAGRAAGSADRRARARAGVDRTRHVYRALAIAAIAACTGDGARRGAAPAARAQTAAARRGEIADRVLVTGTLAAKVAEQLRVPRTEVWNLAIRWLVEDGTHVKAGERVLEFDNTHFVTQLQEKKLGLLGATMDFRTFEDTSRLELEQKEFALATAKIGLAKARVLASVPADLLPARVAQDRQLELRRAEAAVGSAERELGTARTASELDLRVKQIELDKVRREIETAERVVGQLSLAAPRDGVALLSDNPWEDRRFKVGDSTQPGWTVVTLPDFSAGIEVRAELPDVDDGRLSVGMRGTCTLDAYPSDPVPCSVTNLMPVATGQSDGASLRRAFAVVLSLERTDRERMRPGMAAKVELRRQPVSGILVPRGAVRWTPGGARVQLAAGGLREVTLGPCDPQHCIADTGIADGELVRIGGAP